MVFTTTKINTQATNTNFQHCIYIPPLYIVYFIKLDE